MENLQIVSLNIRGTTKQKQKKQNISIFQNEKIQRNTITRNIQHTTK